MRKNGGNTAPGTCSAAEFTRAQAADSDLGEAGQTIIKDAATVIVAR